MPAPKRTAFTHNPTVQLTRGTVATSPVAKPRPTKYDWETARDLLESNPGLWVLTFNNFSSGMFSYARRGGPAALRELGGDLQLSLRNQVMVGKTKFGTLWARWTPEGWTEDDQAAAEAAHAAGEGVL
jgi:hypothetical protein